MTNCMIFYIILKEGDLMYKLLIVEDDFIIAKGLQKSLINIFQLLDEIILALFFKILTY